LPAWQPPPFRSGRVGEGEVRARLVAPRLVQRHALRAWDEERDFRDLVAADPEITNRLDEAALADAFDLEEALRHVDVLFERLGALTTDKENAIV